jgi:hypothetical protein
MGGVAGELVLLRFDGEDDPMAYAKPMGFLEALSV